MARGESVIRSAGSRPLGVGEGAAVLIGDGVGTGENAESLGDRPLPGSGGAEEPRAEQEGVSEPGAPGRVPGSGPGSPGDGGAGVEGPCCNLAEL